MPVIPVLLNPTLEYLKTFTFLAGPGQQRYLKLPKPISLSTLTPWQAVEL
jgi:hypothetical protein